MSKGKKRRIRLPYVLVAVLVVLAATVSIIALRPGAREDTSSFTPAAPSIATREPLPLAAFIGDSYVSGSGTTDRTKRWSTQMSNSLNWVESNMGKGGTGYVRTSNQNGCGLAYCPNFAEMVPEAVKLSPSIVVIGGGRNDSGLSPEQTRAAVRKTLQGLHAALPAASIITLPPFYNDKPLPPALVELGQIIKDETQSVGGFYLDIGQPLLNHPDLIAADGVHPTDTGYTTLTAVIVDSVRALNNPKLVKG